MEDKIKVVVCRPMEAAVVEEIDNTLEAYQTIVGGYIEFVYPFKARNAVLVCNEEGRLLGLTPNRYFNDMIVGTFFIASEDEDEGELCSLSEEDIDAIRTICDWNMVETWED